MSAGRESQAEVIGVFERMAMVMSQVASEHRDNGDEDAAKHCAGGAEAWLMAANYMRLRIEADTPRGVRLAQNWPRLKVVS